MTKVLLANKFFFLNGGSETVFFQERDFLIKNGFPIIDFSMHDARNFASTYVDFFIPHINFQKSNGIFRRIIQAKNFIHSTVAVKNIEKLILQEQPSIAHLHNIYHQLTPAIIPVLKKHGVKIILTLHDGKLICPSYLMLNKGNICTACEGKKFWKPMTLRCQNSFMQGFLLSLEAYWHKVNKSYEDIDVFLSPSRFLANLIGKRFPSSRIKVLHNGIDHEKYHASKQDKGYALYFGRLSKEKGIDTLLKAHHCLHEDTPLKIVGTGPLEKELRPKYPNVHFLGFKNGEELNEIISFSSFVIVPSEWYENCSMVILEAMAHGKPIIASRIGGIPEQVEDGETGLLFEAGSVRDLAEKMKIMSENHSMRLLFGKNAREKLIRNYSLKKHCNDLLEIYQNI